MTPYSVLEEAINEDLTQEWVERRIDDWQQRIETLYRDIESWLPEGWSARRGPPYSMRANLLEKFGLGRRELPTLELVRGGVVRGRLYPDVLWILGVNGRLNLVKDKEIYYVSDYAEIFEAPRWFVVHYGSSMSKKPLLREVLLEILNA